MPLPHWLTATRATLQTALHHFRRLIGQDRNKGARFASPLQQHRILNAKNTGFLLDGRSRALSLKNSYRNVLTLGAVGTGKSTIGVIPHLLTQRITSGVVLDTSGEIFDQTAGYLTEQGYRIEVLDLMNPGTTGLQYNPLANRTDILSIHKACQQIVLAGGQGSPSDQFWNDGAINLQAILAYCLHQCDPQYANLENLKTLISRFDLFTAKPGHSQIDHFVAQHTRHSETVFSAYMSLANGNPQTVLSWVSTAANSLTPLISPQVATLTAQTSFDFTTLQRQRTILYVKVNQRDIEFYRFILNLFFEDLLSTLTQSLDPDNVPVLFLLDEFGQFHIDKFEVFVATARKYKIGLWVFLQSLSQLTDQYGEAKARTILNNLTTKCYFGGIELDTAQQLEKRLGQIKVPSRGGEGLIFQHEPLMSAQEIIELPDDEMLILHGNKPGFRLQGTPHFAQKRWKKVTKMDPPAVRTYSGSLDHTSIIQRLASYRPALLAELSLSK